MTLAFGIILLVLAVFLVVAVLLQQGKNAGLGAISGGNESYYGQGKTMTKDKILSRRTTIVAIVFCIVGIVLFMVQGKDTTTNTPVTDDGHDHVGETASESINIGDTTEPSEAPTEKPTEAAPSETKPAQ